MPRNCPACGQGAGAVSAHTYEQENGREANACPRCGMHKPTATDRLTEQLEGGKVGVEVAELGRHNRLYEYRNQLNKMQISGKRNHNTPEEIALARRVHLRPGDLDAPGRDEEPPEQDGPDPKRVARLAQSIRPSLDEIAQEDGRWSRRDARDLLEGYTDDPDLTRAVVAHLRGAEQ